MSTRERRWGIVVPDDASMPMRATEAPKPGEPIPSHYPWCIGCGDEHPTGLHLRLWAVEGMAIEGVVTIDRHHQGAPGIAHGGLLSTVLDEAMGALNYLLWRPSVTGRLEVAFHRPVSVGSQLAVRTEIVGASGRKVFTRGTLRLEGTDADLVTAAGLFLHVPLEHFVEHGDAAWSVQEPPAVAP